MYRNPREMIGGRISASEEAALYEGAFEAVKNLPPGIYTPEELARRVPNFPRYTVMASAWRMVDRGLAEFTPHFELKILDPPIKI